MSRAARALHEDMVQRRTIVANRATVNAASALVEHDAKLGYAEACQILTVAALVSQHRKEVTPILFVLGVVLSLVSNA